MSTTPGLIRKLRGGDVVKKTFVIRQTDGGWREIPTGVIGEVRHFLRGGTDEQVADYVARVMEIVGPYEAGFRVGESGDVVIPISGTMPPRQEGDPILTLPDGSRYPGARLVAHYINPDRQ